VTYLKLKDFSRQLLPVQKIEHCWMKKNWYCQQDRWHRTAVSLRSDGMTIRCYQQGSKIYRHLLTSIDTLILDNTTSEPFFVMTVCTLSWITRHENLILLAPYYFCHLWYICLCCIFLTSCKGHVFREKCI
jgi:hypothetical protein